MGQRDEEEDEEGGEEEQEDLHTVMTMMMAVMTMMTTVVTVVMSLEYSTCRQSTPLMRSPTAMPRAAATAGRMKT